jgi:hypothetical protein
MIRILGAARVAATLAVAGMLVLPSVASADVPVSHRGSVGAHSLTDSQEYPGASCWYDRDMNVARVKVRPPTVFARDRSSSRDHQSVGWVVELRYQGPGGGSWSTVQKSSVATATAWDDTAAPFRTRSVTIAHPKGSGSWQVVVRMLWYKPGTSSVWQGTARHRVSFYDYPLAGPGDVAFCPAGIL